MRNVALYNFELADVMTELPESLVTLCAAESGPAGDTFSDFPPFMVGKLGEDLSRYLPTYLRQEVEL